MKLLYALILTFFCMNVYATQCTVAGQSYPWTVRDVAVNVVSTINVPVDAPPGKMLVNFSISSITYITINCPTAKNLYMTVKGNQSDITGVYKLPSPGIGIKSSSADSWGPVLILNGVTNAVLPSTAFQVLKLDETIQAGTVSIGKFATFQIYDDGRYYDVANLVVNSQNNIVIQQCTTSHDVNVPLGDLYTADLLSVGGVYNSRQVRLNVNCSGSVVVNATLEGIQNPDTSTPGVLALSGQGSEGVASGIGVQLLYGSSALELNKPLSLKTVNSGSNNLNFSARFYQTKDSTDVKAGTANATATLRLTYE